jgi:oligopeptide/dipeptide ABC transporter ATP-binding protein
MFKIINLTKSFAKTRAVHDLSFSILPGETLGLVGESGSGKSTLGHLLLRLYEPTSGEILFEGSPLAHLKKEQLQAFRKKTGLIFQDPYASLNPRMTVAEIVREPLDIHKLYTKEERKEKVKELLHLVGLSSDHLVRFPHELSGGQRQRIGIARAIAAQPQFIVCDEAISALDVSVQAQIINLLKKLQQEMALTFLFIAHDLRLVKYVSDRVAVMYLGEIVELGEADSLFAHPLHPYTEALLSAIPIPDPKIERSRKRIVLTGEALPEPQGCPFANRCPKAQPQCRQIRPVLQEIDSGRFAACHLLGR